MMPIFTLMTIASSLRIARCSRWLRCWGVLAIVLSATSANVHAADKTPSHPAAQVAARASDPLVPAPGRSHPDKGAVFCNGIRPQDEIVLVNMRNLCGNCDPEKLRAGVKFETYSVCDDAGAREWKPSNLESFLAFNPSVPTVIFVHGNQISPGYAKFQGLAVYRHAIAHGSDAPPIRFLIFSWPSSQIPGLLEDVRVKAARTGPAGYQLAWLIDQMQPETPISLVGFSFGARIITGGLHVLAGGSLGGSACLHEHVHPDRPPMSVIMMASALHSYWLAEGQYHGLTMTQVSHMCLINNCEDNAMKYYDYLEPGFGGPQALGLCGPTCIGRDYARKIVNRDVSCSVGSEHLLMLYVCAPGDSALIWKYTAGSAFSDEKTGG